MSYPETGPSAAPVPGGHPLFPRAATDPGPDRRRFDYIIIHRWLPDGTFEQCPRLWTGSELRSWEQVVNTYGGGCTYQLIAICSAGQIQAQSGRFYFGSPATKPFSATPFSVETPANTSLEMLRLVLKSRLDEFDKVKELMLLKFELDERRAQLAEEREQRGMRMGVEFYREAQAIAEQEEVQRARKASRASAAARAPEANTAPMPAPAPAPPQQPAASPPFPAPQGYVWLFTPHGWALQTVFAFQQPVQPVAPAPPPAPATKPRMAPIAAPVVAATPVPVVPAPPAQNHHEQVERPHQLEPMATASEPTSPEPVDVPVLEQPLAPEHNPRARIEPPRAHAFARRRTAQARQLPHAPAPPSCTRGDHPPHPSPRTPRARLVATSDLGQARAPPPLSGSLSS